MINELYQLAEAMENAGIATESWHREYKPIPNVRPNAPCVRIVVANGRVIRLESVSKELAAKLRKYGSNQGSFPAMNLAPLYRVCDEEIAKQITGLLKNGGESLDLAEVHAWCTSQNWGAKFAKKYRISMEATPEKLSEMLSQKEENESIQHLIEEVRCFSEPQVLHVELERAVFELLEKRIDVALALQILFYIGKPDKSPSDDFGSLSVILDSERLEDRGYQTAGIRFTKEFNQWLQRMDSGSSANDICTDTDAFGEAYSRLDEPMPSVKLAGGFDVSLRTMFKGQPCQYRYGRIENDTYPISRGKRYQLSDALTWLSGRDMQDKTWINIDAKEILFVYPSRLPETPPEFIHQFSRRKRPEDFLKAQFETQAAEFREYISRTKKVDKDHFPDHIQIFVLRKLDKARTKVLFSRNTTPDEIIRQSDGWQDAADNLPTLPIGKPWTPFPMEIPLILNRTWTRDGEAVTGKYQPVASYHGMELLFGVPQAVRDRDLHLLAENSLNFALYAGDLVNTATKRITDEKKRMEFKKQTGLTLVLTGMLLAWRNIRKDDYVNDFPYLLGQLLKLSDSLHELYCWCVRDRQIPPRLVGNSMYVFASEAPYNALAQLGGRLGPYLAWARVNRTERIVTTYTGKDGETVQVKGPTAGYLLSVFEKTADRLQMGGFNVNTRFTDSEKAQMFIGYLASFPRSETKPAAGAADTDLTEDTENEN